MQPVAALKLTGKVSGFGVGALSGVDDRAYSASGTDNPVYNILRVRRDLGGQSTVGLVYTDKIDGADYNRVAGADARIVFGGGAYRRAPGRRELHARWAAATVTAPLWYASLDRTGRQFGFTYSIGGDRPRTSWRRAGSSPAPGIAIANIDHRLTRYGRPGAAIESWTGDCCCAAAGRIRISSSGKMPGRSVLPHQLDLAGSRVDGARRPFTSSRSRSTPRSTRLPLQHTAGGVTDTVPFIGVPRIPNYDLQFTLQTPQFRRFNASLLLLPAIQDENFFEWSPAWIIFIQAGLDWRPSDRLRVNATYLQQQYWRKTRRQHRGAGQHPPGEGRVPGGAVALRAGGGPVRRRQWQDSLRDDSRTNDPILIRNPERASMSAPPPSRPTPCESTGW